MNKLTPVSSHSTHKKTPMQGVYVGGKGEIARDKPSSSCYSDRLRRLLRCRFVNELTLVTSHHTHKKHPRGVFMLAERVRFELTRGLHPRRFSRPLHSTTLPPFHNKIERFIFAFYTFTKKK